MNKLPDKTINLIKSGQVVTAVSNVIKELIENSLDAEATNIEIRLSNYGLDALEVKDNGTGVAKDEIPKMVVGHCTSKITAFEDLVTVSSYGFRGEALHSLCSVSDLTISSKQANDSVATLVSFDVSGKTN